MKREDYELKEDTLPEAEIRNIHGKLKNKFISLIDQYFEVYEQGKYSIESLFAFSNRWSF